MASGSLLPIAEVQVDQGTRATQCTHIAASQCSHGTHRVLLGQALCWCPEDHVVHVLLRQRHTSWYTILHRRPRPLLLGGQVQPHAQEDSQERHFDGSEYRDDWVVGDDGHIGGHWEPQYQSFLLPLLRLVGLGSGCSWDTLCSLTYVNTQWKSVQLRKYYRNN